MQLLTIKEVADKCKMTVEWVTEAIGSGKIPSPIYLDGHERWREKEIDKWIEAGCPPVQNVKGTQNALETDKDDINLKQLEKWAIKHALDIAKGNREQTSRLLGIGERTLYRKIKEYELG
jgi:predicted DNA-binding transcriptional regulator AlpA